MNDYLEERCVEIAKYMIENRSTVRQTAKVFGVSKSTVYKDVAERIFMVNPMLAKEVGEVLQTNKQMRHIRGGLTTRREYKKV